MGKRLFTSGFAGCGWANQQAGKMIATAGEPRAAAGGDDDLPFSTKSQAADADRKMERTASMEIVTKDPADTSEKIRQFAERLGGFLVKSVTNGEGVARGIPSVRIPSERFEEARAEIRRLGKHVDSERVEAEDVTRQYVDLDARLKNLRNEEAQYLSIMKTREHGEGHARSQRKAERGSRTDRGTAGGVSGSFEAGGNRGDQRFPSNRGRCPVFWPQLAAALSTEGGNARRPEQSWKLCRCDGRIFLLPAILLWLTTILLGAAPAGESCAGRAEYSLVGHVRPL